MANKIKYIFIPVPKKIIPALQKTRLSAYENNLIWMYCDLTYGSKDKKKFTKIRYDKIKTRIGIIKSHISRTHRKLKERRILKKTKDGWGINENVHEWDQIDDAPDVRKLPKEVTCLNRQQSIPKHANTVAYRGNKSLPEEDTIKDKENTTTKNIDKDILRIKHFWNNLVKKEQVNNIKGLIRIQNIGKSNGKLDNVLKAAIKEFDFKQIRRSIWNYHHFMSLPIVIRSWKGHRWIILDFITKQVEKFEDWNVVKYNYIKEDKPLRNDRVRSIREGDL